MKDNATMIVTVLVICVLGFGLYRWWSGSTGMLEETGTESSIASSTPLSDSATSGPVSRDVQFLATDGYALAGTYSIPVSQSEIRMPVVVLVHQYNTDRHDFDNLVPRLLADGYAVLAYDSRGSGKSQSGEAFVKDYMKDLLGAIAFLKTQKEVDASALGVIGASVGGNVAFVASGSEPAVKVAIALSPGTTGVRSGLLGKGVSGFAPHNIFIASDDKEKAEANAVFALSKEPKMQKTYPGLGHGVGLLGSPEAVDDIISFLNRFLDVKG